MSESSVSESSESKSENGSVESETVYFDDNEISCLTSTKGKYMLVAGEKYILLRILL